MSTATASTGLKEGRVVAIAGPVIDVEFPRGALPELNQALEFTVMVDGKIVLQYFEPEGAQPGRPFRT